MYTQSLLAALLLLLCVSVNGEVCVGTLPTLQHRVSGQLCIINQTTLVIRNFNYDSGGPDAHLYYYGPPFTANDVLRNYQTGGGNFIPHPQTGGRFPFRVGMINGATLVFNLPRDVFACDIAVFTIWCQLANAHFTALDIPASTFTTDASEAASNPDLILCNRNAGDGGGAVFFPTPSDFDNCKQLHPSLSLSWTVNRTSESVKFMLCGCTGSDAATDNTWLGFGLSGSASSTLMFGADATIVWVDDEEGPQAVDYYLSAYTQCRNGVGACPDAEDSSGACSNDVTLLQGRILNDQQCVVFSRNFSQNDKCDLELDPDNQNQYIVWGVGGLGETAFRHFLRAQAGDPPLHLGRESSSDCTLLQCSDCKSFINQRIAAPSNRTFVAHIGPSGDQRGYMGITGNAGWGIAWFIDGTLIPELVVQRNQTYTFVIFGGDDDSPEEAANYHPFYITDSPSGGRLLNDANERMNEIVYAGFDGEDRPTGVGPLCTYESTMTADELLFDCEATLSEYEEALTAPDSTCGASSTTNSFTWTPDNDTPDLVYYQCASHLNLGWQIRVTDSVKDYIEENPRTVDSGSQPFGFHASVWLCLSLALILLQTLLLQ